MAEPRLRKTWRSVRISIVRETAETPFLVRSGYDVVGLLHGVLGTDDPREHFVAVYLDAKHRPLAVHVVSVGTVNASLVHPREVFLPAVALSAVSLIVAHNHPTGDPTPSREDKLVTDRLREAGTILGIELLDHLVLGEGRYFSFAEERVLIAPGATRTTTTTGGAT